MSIGTCHFTLSDAIDAALDEQTPEQLAVAASVSVWSIRNWRDRNYIPSWEKWLALAAYLKISEHDAVLMWLRSNTPKPWRSRISLSYASNTGPKP